MTTITVGVPIDATSLASTVAVTWVDDTIVVGLADVPTHTRAPGMNPVPVTVSRKSALPAATLAGARLVIVGLGFDTVTVGLVAIAG